MPKKKQVKASSIKTKAQFEKAKRDGVEIIFDDPVPRAKGKSSKKR